MTVRTFAVIEREHIEEVALALKLDLPSSGAEHLATKDTSPNDPLFHPFDELRIEIDPEFLDSVGGNSRYVPKGENPTNQIDPRFVEKVVAVVSAT